MSGPAPRGTGGPDVDLRGRAAVVTGAGNGLGWGVARALARAGAAVLALDLDGDGLARLARDAAADPAAPGDAEEALEPLVLDVSDGDALEAAIRAFAERRGRLDAFVHAAIFMPLAPLREVDPASWRRQTAVGLDAFYRGARAARPAMLASGGGHLVGVASGSSLRGYADEVAYCAIKHALEGFCKALAIEERPHGVAVNTVGPGATVKPTRMGWAELEALPEGERAAFADPVELGRAFAWLVAQPPARLSGLRLDAGPIVATLDREGPDFALEPEKVTLYPDDLRARLAWYASLSPFETEEAP